MRVVILVPFLVLLAIAFQFPLTLHEQWIWTLPNLSTKKNVQELRDVKNLMEDKMEYDCSVWAKKETFFHVFTLKQGLRLPDHTTATAVCNSTVCMLLQRHSWVFSYSSDITYERPAWLSNNNTYQADYTFMYNTDDIHGALGYDSWTKSTSFYNSKHHAEIFGATGHSYFQLAASINDVDKIVESYSTYQRINNLVIIIERELPITCAYITICHPTMWNCISYSPLSVSFATIFNRTSKEDIIRPNFMSLCSGIEPNPRGRRDAQSDEKKPSLSFNLPWTRFCGPGTDVEEADNAGGALSSLDEACRQHDINYMMGMDAEKADAILLQDVWKTGSLMYPAFSLFFAAKRYFEQLTGDKYTSALYYTSPATKGSLARYFYSVSAYDGLNTTDPEYAIGKLKEDRWKALVHDIWRGYCYAKQTAPMMPSSTSGNPTNNDLQETQKEATSTPPPQAGPSEPCLLPRPATGIDYPFPPGPWSGCRLVINELASRNDETPNSFVELQKFCEPKTKRNRAKSLDGFMLYVLEAGDPPKMLMSADLTGFELTEVEQYVGLRYVTKYFFVVGTGNIATIDMRLESADSAIPFFPDGNVGTYAIVLTHIPLSEIKKMTVPVPQFPADSAEAHELTAEEMIVIEMTMQDIFVYGQECEIDACDHFRRWLRNPNMVLDGDLVPMQDVAKDSSDVKRYKSISRCTSSHLPMQNDKWDFSTPTPQLSNICPKEFPLPYKFRGFPLKSSARKIIVNLLTYLEAAQSDKQLLAGTPVNIAAAACNLHRSVVQTVYRKHQETDIKTPQSRGRKRKSKVVDSFDSFDIDLIKRKIKWFYERKQPPFFDDIYKESMAAFSAPDRSDGGTIKQRCSKNTFRILLKKIGFRYGQIKFRDVILQRSDIVKKRHDFIKRIRDNRAGEKLPLVYTVHMRTGKAWVPSKVDMSWNERKKYVYAKHKPNRGKRLIVIHAAHEETGLIHGAMKVYGVGGDKEALDYHQNVDSDTYFTWFSTLLNELEPKGKHLIVIDNAPYHSKSDAPKSSDRKSVMEEFVKANDPTGSVTGYDSTKKYLKFDLWNMVKQLKTTNPHYRIDREAQKRGQEILRFPPYNCDLNPIEEVWHDLKHYVRVHNEDQTLASVKVIAEQYFLCYTAQQFQQHMSHIRQLEDEYWINDKGFNTLVSKEKIKVTEEPGDTTDDDDDDDDIDDTAVAIAQEAHPVQSLVHDGEIIRIASTGEVLDNDEDAEGELAQNPPRRQLEMC